MKARFLIVDDDSKKVETISAKLRDLGVNCDAIDSADSARVAWLMLSSRHYDVLLLDVLLPNRSGDIPGADASIELLRQLVEDGSVRPPTVIVAITASLDAVDEFHPVFRSMVVQVLHVDPASDVWITSLKRLTALFDAPDKGYDFDICFQTALRAPEMEAVIDNLGVEWQGEEPLSRGLLFRRGVVACGGSRLRVVAAHANQMGLVAATQLTGELIRTFRPRILLMPGICGGLKDTQIGDVIVAERSWDWQSGKWDDDAELLAAPDQVVADADLVALARARESVLTQLHRDYDGVRPDSPGRVRSGPMISGSSVVISQEMHRIFTAQHRKVEAVDMECYGVYFAGSMTNQGMTKVLCAKAVSDLANAVKDDRYQRYCSFISAGLLMDVAMVSLGVGR